MGADYGIEPEDDGTQVLTQMVVEDDDPGDDSLIHLYDHVFTLPLAKPVCTTALSAVQRSASLLSIEGKEILKKEVKEIAKSVSSPTDSKIGLDDEEARVCIEETTTIAQESTIASRLGEVFPIANPTGEVNVQIDPSKLQVVEGPQHDLLTTSLMDEIIVMFDPKQKNNIPWMMAELMMKAASS